jgi:hypothetical protein
VAIIDQDRRSEAAVVWLMNEVADLVVVNRDGGGHHQLAATVLIENAPDLSRRPPKDEWSAPSPME